MRSRVIRLLPLAVFLFAVPLIADTFPFGGPRSTNNDDSCDVTALPAATLLLPFFEVDLSSASGETTLFTVTNVADRAQIVRVTLWTDYAYPVLSFNIYLTGYDVQSINVRDILTSGRIGADSTGTTISPRGPLSRSAGPGHDTSACAAIPHINSVLVSMMQTAFTEGHVPLPNDATCVVGGVHSNAVGYATIDVVSRCTDSIPSDDIYFAEDIRYDNVLMGEYQQLNPANKYAQGGTMVQVRAIPEGGTQQSRLDDPAFAENFPRTFYQRLYPHASRSDSRQPLPSTFAGRWIDGGPAGFQTLFKIWREASTRDGASCGSAVERYKEIVVFDERENVFSQLPVGPILPPPPVLPATAIMNIRDASIFPPVSNGAVAGWVYFNLDGIDNDPPRADQAWVISSMRAEGRYSGDMDANALGNGCSAETPYTEINHGTQPIGPAPNTTP